MRTLQAGRLLLLVIAAVACGCGQSRYDVSGRVAYDDGQPFTGGGLIALEGTVGGKAVMARGAIEPDGRFMVSAGKPGQGVLAGSYRVRLIPSHTVNVDAPATPLPYDKKFLDCDTSGIAVDVGRGTKDFTISLGPRP